MDTSRKEEIKTSLIEKVNNLLECEDEKYRLDKISILNNKEFTGFMASIRVYNHEKLEKIQENLEKLINTYGDGVVNQRHIVPCCELPYDFLSFNIKVYKDEKLC